MKSKDFYAWLYEAEADHYETDQSFYETKRPGDNTVTVTFCNIEFPTYEEERKEALEQAIKALEDLLEEPYVLMGNAVESGGKLYSDTAAGLMNALEILKGDSK